MYAYNFIKKTFFFLIFNYSIIAEFSVYRMLTVYLEKLLQLYYEYKKIIVFWLLKPTKL